MHVARIERVVFEEKARNTWAESGSVDFVTINTIGKCTRIVVNFPSPRNEIGVIRVFLESTNFFKKQNKPILPNMRA